MPEAIIRMTWHNFLFRLIYHIPLVLLCIYNYQLTYFPYELNKFRKIWKMCLTNWVLWKVTSSEMVPLNIKRKKFNVAVDNSYFVQWQLCRSCFQVLPNSIDKADKKFTLSHSSNIPFTMVNSVYHFISQRYLFQDLLCGLIDVYFQQIVELWLLQIKCLPLGKCSIDHPCAFIRTSFEMNWFSFPLNNYECETKPTKQRKWICGARVDFYLHCSVWQQK